MKIWLINHYAASQFKDRAGRHYWFAKELKNRGYDVSVFCASTFLNSEEKIEIGNNVLAVKRVDGIPFVFVKTTFSEGNGIERVGSWIRFYKRLFPASKAYSNRYGKPDVIIASSVHPLTMVAGLQIAKKMHIPCICEIRDLWPEAIFQFGKAKKRTPLGIVLTIGEHWIYKSADALIFTKEGDTDYLKEKKWTTEQGGDVALSKCYYINNGVDIVDYEKRIREYPLNDADLNDGKFNITYAGTIRPINSVGNLLDAAKIISKCKGYEDVQFLIYGDGVELPKLRERVVAENIKNVKLKGFVDRKHIPYILSCSSVNMLNYSQGQYNWTRGNSSNKLFEYMASGKPIISTVRMGYSIIKKYNCGVELDEDSPEALAKQVIQFHDMDKDVFRKMGENAKNGAKDFDFKVLTDRLEEVVKSIL